MEKFVESLAAFQMLEERLNRHPRADKDWRSAQDVPIAVDDLVESHHMEGCSNCSPTSSPGGMSLIPLILLPPTKVYRGSMSWHRCIQSETLATASKKTLSRARSGENAFSGAHTQGHARCQANPR